MTRNLDIFTYHDDRSFLTFQFVLPHFVLPLVHLFFKENSLFILLSWFIQEFLVEWREHENLPYECVASPMKNMRRPFSVLYQLNMQNWHSKILNCYLNQYTSIYISRHKNGSNGSHYGGVITTSNGINDQWNIIW